MNWFLKTNTSDKGKVVDDFSFVGLEVSKMEKLPWVKDGRC